MLTLIITSSRLLADYRTCGGATTTLPFTDVQSSGFFCQIAAAYFSGLTNGTSCYHLQSHCRMCTREQMAAFITRTMDQSLKRGSKRAVPRSGGRLKTANSLTLTDVGDSPQQVKFDGTTCG